MRLPRILPPLLTCTCAIAAGPAAFAADRDDDDSDPAAAEAPTTTLEPVRARRGLRLGARLGYSLPNGSLSNDAALPTSISHLETAWVSVGGGWEVAAFSQNAGGGGVTATLTGPVLPDVELGFDSRRGAVGIGPYFGLTLGEFLTHGQSPAETPVPTWIGNPSLHGWFTLGLRGTYGPW